MQELPELRALVGVCRDYFKGNLAREQTLGQLDAVDDMLGQMFSGFWEELRFQERTPLLAEQAPAVLEAFDELWEVMLKARRAIYDQHRDVCLEALQDARALASTILISFALLRQEAAGRQHYSGSPLVDELCRVGYACLRGALPRELLQERLDGLVASHNQLLSRLPADMPQPLRLALDRQTAALEQLMGSVAQDEALQNALGELRAATDQLLELRALDVESDAPAPRLNVSVGDETRAVLISANLRRLQEAAQLADSGRMDAEEFQTIVSDLNDQVTLAQERLAGMLPPPADTPLDRAEAYMQLRNRMQAGLAAMQDGLSALWNWTESRQPQLLEHGLERVLAGGDRLREAMDGLPAPG